MSKKIKRTTNIDKELNPIKEATVNLKQSEKEEALYGHCPYCEYVHKQGECEEI